MLNLEWKHIDSIKYLEEVKQTYKEVETLAYLTDMDNYTPEEFVPWIKKDAMKELDEDCGEECINIVMLIESSINFVLKKAEEEDE